MEIEGDPIFLAWCEIQNARAAELGLPLPLYRELLGRFQVERPQDRRRPKSSSHPPLSAKSPKMARLYLVADSEPSTPKPVDQAESRPHRHLHVVR